MNIRRGLIRISILLSFSIAAFASVLLKDPIENYIRHWGTRGLEIQKDDGPIIEVRISTEYENLSVDEQNRVASRLFNRLGINSSEVAACGVVRESLEQRLREATASGDADLSALLTRVLMSIGDHANQKNELNLMPWEAYKLQTAIPQDRASVAASEFPASLEKKFNDCRPTNLGAQELENKLELIATGAYFGTRTHTLREILTSLLIWVGLIVSLWLLLFASFWVVAGFQSTK